MISCILLSAGQSNRFGSPKALAKLNGETVIEHLQETMLRSKISETIIVLGSDTDRIKPFILNHKTVKVVYNKDHNFGQTSSFKAGLAEVSSKCKAVFLFPVDYPVIKDDAIDDLVDCFCQQSSLIIIPSYKGQKGHPPLFSMRLKDAFLRLDNTEGLNTVARKYSDQTILLEMKDSDVLKTFNTRQEFEQIRSDMPYTTY